MLGPAFLFGAGLDEWAVLGAIIFLLFGPKRLPEIARTIGRTLEKLRRAADDFREQIAHLDDPPQPPQPPRSPPLPSLTPPAPPPSLLPLPVATMPPPSDAGSVPNSAPGTAQPENLNRTLNPEP